MSYLLTQIWICLLLTALVAGLAGWLLGRGGKSKMKQLEEKWRTKLARAENERDYYAGEVKNLGAIAEEREEMEVRFNAEKESLENELNALRKGVKSKTDSLKEIEEDLLLKANTLEQQNNSLNAQVEEEKQAFSQRIAELEAGEEMSKAQIRDYEEKINALQSQLNDANIDLTETTNKLAEVEAKMGAEDSISGEKSSRGAGLLAGAAGVAAMAGSAVSSAASSATDSVKESLIDPDDNNYSLDVIEAIATDDSRRLRKLGIKTTTDLLEKASNQNDISLIAKSLGKESWVIRSWASVADLLRVPGIDAVDAELLELSGISTVQSLSRAKLDKLADSVKVIHKHVGKTQKRPSQDEISGWISAAAKIEPMLEGNVDKL